MLSMSASTGPLEGASGTCMVYSPTFNLSGFSLSTGWYLRRSSRLMMPPRGQQPAFGKDRYRLLYSLYVLRCIIWKVEELSTCALNVLDNGPRHGAIVEDIRTLVGNPLVGVSQSGEPNNVVFLQDVSLGITKHLAGGWRGEKPKWINLTGSWTLSM